jgi:hypothetical protein
VRGDAEEFGGVAHWDAAAGEFSGELLGRLGGFDLEQAGFVA